MKNLSLNNKRIAVVSHKSIEGLPDELRNYLLKKDVKNLFYIMHPLLYDKESYKKSSKFEYYENNKIILKKEAIHWVLPEIFLYIKDIFYTFAWIFKIKGKFDIFIGVNDLNAFAGVFLKKLGKVKKVVYYNIDYVPKRFNNKLLNSLYRWIDKYCCKNVDLNWVGTKRTVDARITSGVSENKMAKTIVVPDGNYSSRIKKKSIGEIKMNRLAYLGYILKKQGIDLVLESLPKIKEKIKNIEFVIIGSGEYVSFLKKKVKRLELENCVKFMGYLDDRKTEEVLTESAIGVATYVPDKDSFTYYSEAGKPKYYLGCGLPVIITKVPAIASEINDKNAGIAIDYNADEFVNAVFKILKDKKTYEMYKKNATIFGSLFDWSIIFEKAIFQTVRFFQM